jgi:L-seryl-tRNA(Ser) seleniumtransferase
VRTDKLTLAVLEATLKLFLDSEKALQEVPTLRMIVRTEDSLREQAERIAQILRSRCRHTEIGTVSGFSQTGSGSLPAQNLPTTCVTLRSGILPVEDLSQRLRMGKNGQPPVFARIQQDRLLLDPRTLQANDETDLIEALATHLS